MKEPVPQDIALLLLQIPYVAGISLVIHCHMLLLAWLIGDTMTRLAILQLMTINENLWRHVRLSSSALRRELSIAQPTQAAGLVHEAPPQLLGGHLQHIIHLSLGESPGAGAQLACNALLT